MPIIPMNDKEQTFVTRSGKNFLKMYLFVENLLFGKKIIYLSAIRSVCDAPNGAITRPVGQMARNPTLS